MVVAIDERRSLEPTVHVATSPTSVARLVGLAASMAFGVAKATKNGLSAAMALVLRIDERSPQLHVRHASEKKMPAKTPTSHRSGAGQCKVPWMYDDREE